MVMGFLGNLLATYIGIWFGFSPVHEVDWRGKFITQSEKTVYMSNRTYNISKYLQTWVFFSLQWLVLCYLDSLTTNFSVSLKSIMIMSCVWFIFDAWFTCGLMVSFGKLDACGYFVYRKRYVATFIGVTII